MKARNLNKPIQWCEPKDVHEEVEKQGAIGNFMQSQFAV